MQRHIRFDVNPGASGMPRHKWHYYYLYGLERLGHIARVRFVGDEDWYLQGALKSTEPDPFVRARRTIGARTARTCCVWARAPARSQERRPGSGFVVSTGERGAGCVGSSPHATIPVAARNSKDRERHFMSQPILLRQRTGGNGLRRSPVPSSPSRSVRRREVRVEATVGRN